MKQSLEQKCELLVRNRNALKSVSRFQFTEMRDLGALLYTLNGQEADVAKVKLCKKLIKKHAGPFSNFRGNIKFAILVKMALAQDPEEYIKGVMEVYKKLTSHRKIRTEYLAITASVIYEQCPREEQDRVIEKTKIIYEEMKQQHRLLTSDNDTTLAALIAIYGDHFGAVLENAEQCYEYLGEHFRVSKDTLQSVSQILSLSKKPVPQKCDDFWELRNLCKKSGHNLYKGKQLGVLAAFSELDVDNNILAQEIGEVDDYLKHCRGFGLSIGGTLRRTIASALVLSDHHDSGDFAAMNAAAKALTQVVIQEVIITLIIVIIISIQMSQHAASSSN